MSKKQQVEKTPARQMSDEAQAADEQGSHSNLDPSIAAVTPAVVSSFRMKRVKSVAVPLFKFTPNQPRFYLVDGPMFVGKKIDDKKEAATLLPVTDLETGEQGQIILGAVLVSLIEESYCEFDADDNLIATNYVGKKFEMTLRKRADKAYNTYDLYEVGDE